MYVATGIALLAVFLAVVALIIRGQSPVVMLLVLAIAWAALAGIGLHDIQAKVLQGGGVAFASAVIIIVFGAWFAQILIQTGVAESVIRVQRGDATVREAEAGGPHCRAARPPPGSFAGRDRRRARGPRDRNAGRSLDRTISPPRRLPGDPARDPAALDLAVLAAIGGRQA